MSLPGLATLDFFLRVLVFSISACPVLCRCLHVSADSKVSHRHRIAVPRTRRRSTDTTTGGPLRYGHTAPHGTDRVRCNSRQSEAAGEDGTGLTLQERRIECQDKATDGILTDPDHWSASRARDRKSTRLNSSHQLI